MLSHCLATLMHQATGQRVQKVVMKEQIYIDLPENMFHAPKSNYISIYASVNKFRNGGCFWNWSVRNCLNSCRSSLTFSLISTWLI